MSTSHMVSDPGAGSLSAGLHGLSQEMGEAGLPEPLGGFVCFFCFDSCICSPLHGTRRAMAAAVLLPLAGQQQDFLIILFRPQASLRSHSEVSLVLFLHPPYRRKKRKKYTVTKERQRRKTTSKKGALAHPPPHYH